jgi:pimeloyl-[acyl-carrier protein] methyl ester esterase
MDLHVERAGRGPVLLLLHGWAMHGGVFAPLVRALSEHFEVITVDLPGHGRSRDSALPLTLEAVADALVQVIDPAGAGAGANAAAPVEATRALVVGWSLGGLVATAFAARHPSRVRGLGLIAASPRFVQAPDWPAGMDPRVFEVFGEELGRDYRGTLDRFLMLEAQGSARLREELRYLRDAVYARGEPAPRALHDGLALLQGSDLRHALPGLAVPSLWIAGRRDRLVSPQAMQAAAALAPRSRVQVDEHAGHAPFLTAPDAVAEALTAFAAECAL